HRLSARPRGGDHEILDRDRLTDHAQDGGTRFTCAPRGLGSAHVPATRRRSARRAGAYGTYAGHHIAPSTRSSTSVSCGTPARPASIASPATATAIARVTRRRS